MSKADNYFGIRENGTLQCWIQERKENWQRQIDSTPNERHTGLLNRTLKLCVSKLVLASGKCLHASIKILLRINKAFCTINPIFMCWNLCYFCQLTEVNHAINFKAFKDINNLPISVTEYRYDILTLSEFTNKTHTHTH